MAEREQTPAQQGGDTGSQVAGPLGWIFGTAIGGLSSRGERAYTPGRSPNMDYISARGSGATDLQARAYVTAAGAARAEGAKLPYRQYNIAASQTQQTSNTYTSGTDGYVYPSPPKDWKGGLRLWEELSRTMGSRQPPRVVSPPSPPSPPRTPPIQPGPGGPTYTPTGASGGVPNYVTRELIAESWFIIGQNLQRELSRRAAERIKSQVEAKKGPRTRGGRRRRIVRVRDPAKEAIANMARGDAPLTNIRVTARPMLEPVTITAEPMLEPVQVTAQRMPAPSPAPKTPSKWRTLSSWLLPKWPDLLRLATPQARTRARPRDPLTVPQTPGLPFSSLQPQAFGSGAYSFTSGNQTCTCKDQGPKKKKRKSKRETCYRGTYTETSTGLIKRKARKVPCK
jgi:hypothetical protein